MSRQHKETRDQRILYTSGPDALKWERSRSSSSDCGSKNAANRRADPQKNQKNPNVATEGVTIEKEKSRDRSKERDRRDYSKRTKQSRRSDSPATGDDDDGNSQQSTNESEKDQESQSLSAVGDLDTEEPLDKERIHRETQRKLEKLRSTMSKEGKASAKSKPSGSYFANDGSFMDIFKKMQQEKVNIAAPYIVAAAVGAPAPPPLFAGRRRGGKILKTGRVPKLKDPSEKIVDPKDFWSVYQAEVDKYSTTGCDKEEGSRKLVK